jgi:hypothetical protein
LRHLEGAILAGAADLDVGVGRDSLDSGDASAAAVAGRHPRAPRTENPVPAQLPPDVRSFVGRTGYLRRLDSLLADEGGGTERFPSSVAIAVIAGTGGVGKTSLAVRWAHQVRRHFPDGQLYVNLRGFDAHGDPVSAAEALRGLLEALQGPEQQIPATVQGQIGLYRSLLADKRILLLLDNARHADQVRPLLPNSPGCFVLVTSRSQLASLVATEGAHPVHLDLPTTAEATRLLASRLGRARVAAERDAVGEIIARCARLRGCRSRWRSRPPGRQPNRV